MENKYDELLVDFYETLIKKYEKLVKFVINDYKNQIALKDEHLKLIYGLSVGYDGFNDIDGLKSLIDDMARYAKKGLNNIELESDKE